MTEWAPVLAVFGPLVGALATLWFTRRKTAAEAAKIKAEAVKVTADTGRTDLETITAGATSAVALYEGLAVQLRTEVGELKTELAAIQADRDRLRVAVEELKAEMHNLTAELRQYRRAAAEVNELRQEIRREIGRRHLLEGILAGAGIPVPDYTDLPDS